MVMRIQGISGNLNLQHEHHAIANGMHVTSLSTPWKLLAEGTCKNYVEFPRILVPCPCPSCFPSLEPIDNEVYHLVEPVS